MAPGLPPHPASGLDTLKAAGLEAVKALASAGQQFAIRSGGHTQYPGANNIDNGVTIDLGLMKWTRYKPESETVDVGPAGRWRDVYAELRPHERVVAGGREGGVGFAGMLLGGGNTFLTARLGCACDNVLAYETGGSSNFGIVTNFTLRAIENDEVWGGLAIFPKLVSAQAAEALPRFNDIVVDDVDSNLLTLYTYMDVVVVAMYAQVAGIPRAPSYPEWPTLPGVATTYKQISITEMAAEYNLPTGYYNTWFTADFLNDTRIVSHAVHEHEGLVGRLKVRILGGDFITQCLFQPLPAIFAQQAIESGGGGNVLGLERQSENALMWLAAIMVRTPEQEKFAYEEAQGWVQRVREFAATIPGGNQEWEYLNYADGSQDPLASYGPTNAQKLREVSGKYDPQQVFQRFARGGFKIATSSIAK
ncbi:FAD-binding domain-containing protein [Dissoconium aciculare CBS 342.82]|uniref:FAD-binding domain-containing protein n=1 Tax=Dissoconium aciculare CBS 342.82 TaxID=1314786 RepID=A0A6J3MDC3_9PEZI|nr:FAD-binding domain-containing protein [Dissoconium aciculare CBS 342.82]KAF1824842.1 FAD-binding domain-containing protein [Dissoconium aciculare CBS 342.82]